MKIQDRIDNIQMLMYDGGFTKTCVIEFDIMTNRFTVEIKEPVTEGYIRGLRTYFMGLLITHIDFHCKDIITQKKPWEKKQQYRGRKRPGTRGKDARK
jgi:hypothetical protein